MSTESSLWRLHRAWLVNRHGDANNLERSRLWAVSSSRSAAPTCLCGAPGRRRRVLHRAAGLAKRVDAAARASQARCGRSVFRDVAILQASTKSAAGANAARVIAQARIASARVVTKQHREPPRIMDFGRRDVELVDLMLDEQEILGGCFVTSRDGHVLHRSSAPAVPDSLSTRGFRITVALARSK